MVDPSALIVALIALVASLASTAYTTYHSGRLLHHSDLQQVRAVRTKYENAILHAAFELHLRLYAILELSFTKNFDRGERVKQYVVEHTIYQSRAMTGIASL